MENPIAQPSPKRQSASPSNSDLADLIGAILSHFFWADLDAKARAVLRASWIRSLSGVTPRELQAAWDTYQRKGARDESGRLAKPVPHDLRAIVDKARHDAHKDATRHLPPPPEPERDRCPPDVARKIMEAAGFKPRRFR